MIIFDYDPKSGNGSGYNLPNTQENVEYILADFEFWTK